jgi:hypothetical protein
MIAGLRCAAALALAPASEFERFVLLTGGSKDQLPYLNRRCKVGSAYALISMLVSATAARSLKKW